MRTAETDAIKFWRQ